LYFGFFIGAVAAGMPGSGPTGCSTARRLERELLEAVKSMLWNGLAPSPRSASTSMA
jgi:hypothetical protein